MDIELEREKIRVFIKTGLCVMSALLVIMLLGLGVPKLVDAIAAERKLPIYCAPATEAKVALTFDGAWGDGGFGKRTVCILQNAFFNISPYYLQP